MHAKIQGKHRFVSKLVTLSVVLVAAICAYALYVRYRSRPWTRDGQLRADTVQITPRVSGYLVNIAVKDNQQVKAGELLFQIDPRTYQLAVEQAEVDLDQARQSVEQLTATVRVSAATVKEREAAATSAKSQIDSATASVESADAVVSESNSGITAAQAVVAQVKAELAEAEREAARAQRLADSKAGSVQTAEAKQASVLAYRAQVDSSIAELEQAKATLVKSKAAKKESEVQLVIAEHGYVEAQAALAASQADLDQSKASLGEPGEANVNIRSAKVALKQAQLNLDWTSIYSPTDGFITNMNLIGDTYVSAGTPFALFVDSASFRADAYFQETKLRHISPGDRATVTLMGHQDRKLKGFVDSIGYAINPPDLAETDGPGNLVPSIEPTFEWIRLAQRVPVRIRFEEVPKDLHLVSGMTASISIDK
ncbi:MAG: HlyD family secretion protein [Rubripirellula sp.]